MFFSHTRATYSKIAIILARQQLPALFAWAGQIKLLAILFCCYLYSSVRFNAPYTLTITRLVSTWDFRNIDAHVDIEIYGQYDIKSRIETKNSDINSSLKPTERSPLSGASWRWVEASSTSWPPRRYSTFHLCTRLKSQRHTLHTAWQCLQSVCYRRSRLKAGKNQGLIL